MLLPTKILCRGVRLTFRLAIPILPCREPEILHRTEDVIPLLIAIPTTAGTGSEATLTAVITDRKAKHKYTMNDFTLIPRAEFAGNWTGWRE